MTKRKVRKIRFTKIEKALYMCALLCLGGTILLRIFFGANIGNLNMSVEKLRYEVNDQNKKNESLVMKVNELTSFDNVKDIVKDMGLAYNKDNIIIIGD